MSEHLEDAIFGEDEPVGTTRSHRRAERRTPKRHGRTWIVVLLALALVGAGAYAALPTIKSAIKSFQGGASTEGMDYPGPGTGEVKVQIAKGMLGEDIATELKAVGVVKTRTAYLEAAKGDPAAAAKIQAGTYVLKKEMTGVGAFTALTNPANRAPGVTVREGLWASEIYPILSEATGVPVKDYQAAAKKPASIGLPAEAKGSVEGWLFPSTYDFTKDMSAAEQLKVMVGQTVKELEKAKVPRVDWEQTMVLASLVEAEAKLDVDRPKVARVFLNRIANIGKAPTYGLLQSDASISYGAKDRRPFPTQEQLNDRTNPYNLRFEPGLPPGPIDNPGAASIEAAAHPAPGDWLFFVAVNLVTGETKYATTLAEHNRNIEELTAWCKANPGNGC